MAECLRQRRSLTIAPEEAKKVSRETSASLSRMNGTIDNIPWKEDDLASVKFYSDNEN